MKERRSRFLINKPLQLRFMAYISFTLILVSLAIILSFYFGIWGGVLDAFSDKQIQEDLLTASRISEYESARISSHEKTPSALAFFHQAERLSGRQREVFKDILDQTNKKLLIKFLGLLILIAWGSIYLSHKMAGPLYRFLVSLEELERGNMSTRIQLRALDEAKFLGAQLNKTTESLDKTFFRLKKIVSESSSPEQMKQDLHEELSKIHTSDTA